MEKIRPENSFFEDRKYGNILDFIGNTPLVPINRVNPNKQVRLLAKLEQLNPGGSIKDRPALYMIKEAERIGALTKNKVVLEATSGNTGIGLSMVCAIKGYRLLLAMSESTSEERRKRLQAFGAQLALTSAVQGTDGAIECVYEIARNNSDQYFLVDQYNNEANWLAHYWGTAQEIWEQTNGAVSAVVATMGTGGTLMGIAKRLKEYNPNVRIVGVEPYPGHHIQGLKNMKESYRPGIFDKSRLDETINVHDEEAFAMVRRLARKEGLFVGMSSGAALVAAIRVVQNIAGGTVVVIFPDGGDRYLSTGIFSCQAGARAQEKETGPCFYNTLTRWKEPFVPLESGKVSMYTCGPTVDGFPHLGLCRRFIVADLIKRHLEYKGFHVTHIINITDLDDRTILGSEKEGLSLEAFTSQYTEAFLTDMDTLLIKRATRYPRTTKYVDDMIALTRTLLSMGIAYERNQSVYFDILRYRDYAKLSGVNLKKIKVGTTVDLNNYEKNHPTDFALFKRSTLGEVKKGIFYKTEWGLCRPGWHIQCAAMSMKHLAKTFDIHTSESNLIFPHNENEIAIAGSITGKPLARCWLHNAPVLVDGKMMSRQSNNLVTLRELFQKGYSGRELRYFFLRTHYRKPLNYSLKSLEAACKELHRLDTFVKKLLVVKPKKRGQNIQPLITDMSMAFEAAMDKDLNISMAMAALFSFIKKANPMVDMQALDAADVDRLLVALKRIDQVLGVLDFARESADVRIEALIRQRDNIRKSRDWKAADRVRDILLNRHIVVLDTPVGPIWNRMHG